MKTLAALLAVLLSACAAPTIDEKTATAEAGYGRVFGRIEFVEDGKEAVWDGSLVAGELALFVRAVGAAKIEHFEMTGDGSFYWPLRAGEYELVGLQLRRKFRTPGPGINARLMLRFSLRQPGQAVYIGHLRVEWESSGYRFAVHDRESSALDQVRDRLASAKLQPSKELMRAEDPGRFKQVTAICSASWGTHCDLTHQGVRPLQPDGTAWTFSEVRTLTPLLEWEPSSRSGVAYDIAIYESLSFAYGLKSVTGLRGTRVAYVEGLREPRYTARLQPGRKYEWSVRLREGDTVSDWSTTSYAFVVPTPMLIGAGWGWGRYFGIATPNK
jgi:hypothetical protein